MTRHSYCQQEVSVNKLVAATFLIRTKRKSEARNSKQIPNSKLPKEYFSLACNYINGINIKSIPLDMQNEKRQIWTVTRSFLKTDNYKGTEKRRVKLWKKSLLPMPCLEDSQNG